MVPGKIWVRACTCWVQNCLLIQFCSVPKVRLYLNACTRGAGLLRVQTIEVCHCQTSIVCTQKAIPNALLTAPPVRPRTSLPKSEVIIVSTVYTT